MPALLTAQQIELCLSNRRAGGRKEVVAVRRASRLAMLFAAQSSTKKVKRERDRDMYQI
jgi:hypothetical protein